MKINKYIATLLCGMALVTVACDDAKEPSYTPAGAQNVPAAYFSLNDNNEVSVEPTDNKITVNVYRENKGEAAKFNLKTTPNEAAAGVFTVPETIEFKADKDTTSFDITFVGTSLQKNTDYSLNFALDQQEESPYFLTSVDYNISLAVWNDVLGEAGETSGYYIEEDFWYDGKAIVEVTFQENDDMPGLYRISNPYAQIGSPTDYMYFNASNPDETFLCNNKGQAVVNGTEVYFDLGVNVNVQGIPNAGHGINLPYYGYYTAIKRDASSYAATYTPGKGLVNFPDGAILRTTDYLWFTYDGGGYGFGANDSPIQIVFPGFEIPEEEEPPTDEWTSLGKGMFTDGIYAPYVSLTGNVPLLTARPDATTYEVEIQQSTEDSNRYRLVNPWKYVEGVGGCLYGDEYDGDYYVEFDITNPNCILMPDVASGVEFPGNGMAYFVNKAYGYLSGWFQQQPTEEQIIASGLNDTYEDGVITIGAEHVWLTFPENEAIADKLYSPAQGRPVQDTFVVFPEAASSAKAAINSGKYVRSRLEVVKNTNYLTKAKKFANSIRNTKAAKGGVKNLTPKKYVERF